MNPVSLSSLKEFSNQVLLKCGVSSKDADITSEVLVTTDSLGVFTHGTKALRGYSLRLRSGGLKPTGQPRVIGDGPSWIQVDGDSSLGMITGVFCMDLAISKARQNGICIVAARNSCHFGAAGYYASMATREDQIGFAMSNDVPCVAAPGSRGAVLGSNPFAFGAPAVTQPSVLLDMSTAIVAGGKIYIAAAEGKPVPSEWLVDENGRPTSQADLYPHRASLSPMAGYKGYGLALMVEILSGVLCGASTRTEIGSWMTDDPSAATDHSHCFMAINPSVFLGKNDFPTRLDDLLRGIRNTIPAAGFDRIRVPGEIERDHQSMAREHGVNLPSDVIQSLRGAAEDNQLPCPEFLK